MGRGSCISLETHDQIKISTVRMTKYFVLLDPPLVLPSTQPIFLELFDNCYCLHTPTKHFSYKK